ncbi:recombinase family protein [Fredinandcohnia sp. FSL W7-1320]|uniref:recombinase family protein n=1 Tax=Fredinandcohnia sp. FSL W7-1320 TaxID=2954540 RepID=UPI0030FDC0B8
MGRSLYNEGIPIPTQEKAHKNANVFWHGSTIRQILELEIYTGCLVVKKTSTISPMITKRIINKAEDWIVLET